MGMEHQGTDGLRARVSQLEGVLGKSYREFPGDIVVSDEIPTDLQWLEAEDTARLLEGISPRCDPQELRPFVQAIIDERLAVGQDSIALPVLKIKLLDKTGGQFNEQDYGWPNLKFLPGGYPDLLELDLTTKHGAAAFVGLPSRAVAVPRRAEGEEGASASVRDATKGRQVRRDLWNAVVDYASGNVYVWDQPVGQAVASDNPNSDHRPVFPTVAPAEVRQWRRECAEDWRQTHAASDRLAAVERWVDSPREHVPASLISLWRQVQRARVVRIVQDFFVEQDLAVPHDAFPLTRPEPSAASQRQLLVRAIDVMSDKELSEVKLPLGVIDRILRSEAPRRR